MTGNIAARRYARALFTLGKNSGVSELEAWSADLTALRALTEGTQVAVMADE